MTILIARYSIMYYIGVDLGGTNIAAGIVNSDFRIVRKGSVPTNVEGRTADEIIKDMGALCQKLVDDEGLTVADIEYVGAYRRFRRVRAREPPSS